MYIPFVMVILGIGACSFVYKDELFGRFNSSKEVTEEEVIDVQPTEPDVQTDATGDVQSTTSDDFIRKETPEEGPDEQPELPGIGECVCPDK